MKSTLVPCLLLAVLSAIVSHAPAAESREWKAGVPGIEFAKSAANSAGIIEVRAGEEAVIPVLRDLQPGLKLGPYFVRGEVRYEKIGGTACLEMWNVFPPARPGEPEGRYFSRTMGEYGPMQKLQGNSAWREFLLPFNTEGLNAAPVALELNVVLPDGGTVWLRNLRVSQFAAPPTPAWLQSKSAAGVVGGALGALIGIFGGTIGTCLRKGKGRNVARAAFAILCTVATAAAIGAAWAVFTRHSIWIAPLGIPAAIVFALLPLFRAQMTHRFEHAELRRMHAADA
jgi:hypothetical protein